MSLLEAKAMSTLTNSTPTTTSVFNKGDFAVEFIKVAETSNSCSSSPPKPLLIATPTVKGSYAVVLFLHGFYLRNYFYKDLLHHISSHGIILVAPQLYEYVSPSGTEEIDSAAKVTNWLQEGLQPKLPENVRADLTKLALAGHSRGGKAAFALALGKVETSLSLKFSVLLGIDPVAGLNKYCRTKPHILTYSPRSFDLSIPVTVIGTGLGSQQKNCLSPPCAPEGLNHEEFFNECKPPCAYFVAKDYGHMDMLDDNPPGAIGELSSCLCKNGTGPRDPMRRSVGGIVVAYLRAYLEADDKDLAAIVGDPSLAPVTLEPVEFVPANKSS
ncbi:Chlorophyllase [Parasponia andersonii]|uniref:chlorophyllase n=1 Tax=Parasponia andersonii TaxID=3476 RepID=A0A2P5DS17_PARAD|nr:Chlorophyllase [Parasponia andersonii]